MAVVENPYRMHHSFSVLSNRTNSTWRSDVFGRPRVPRGAMVYTGPDSVRMHRQKILNPDYIGETASHTNERTGSVDYLWRAAPGTPHPRPKSAFCDSYGWCAWGPTASMCAWLESGQQIKMNTFRQAVENNASHAYQNAWYPGPDDEADQDSGAVILNGHRPSVRRYHSATPSSTRYYSPRNKRTTNSSQNKGRLLSRPTESTPTLQSPTRNQPEPTRTNQETASSSASQHSN